MSTAVSTAEPFSREIPPDDIAYQVREFHVLQMLHYMLGHIWIDPILHRANDSHTQKLYGNKIDGYYLSS